MTKYTKTKHTNIYWYETTKGKRYSVRRLYYQAGKRKEYNKQGFKTLAEAKAALALAEVNISKNELGLIGNDKITVDDYWEIFSDKKIEKKVWSPDSERGNLSLYKNHIKERWGNVRLIQLDRNEYERWIDEKLKEMRRESIRAINILFMSILNDAVLNGSLTRNRLKHIHIGESAIPKRDKYISLDDYKKWITTAEKVLTPYEFAWIYLMLFGLRRGEVAALRQASLVALENNQATLHIFDSRTNQTPKGKGGVKTKHSNRYVTLDEKGTRMFNLIVAESKEIKKDFGQVLHKDDFLFLNHRTGAVYYPSQLNRLMNAVYDATDLTNRPTPHMLRHFFATQAILAGNNLEHVSAYLGHSEKYMTEHYAHLSKEKEMTKKVVDIFSKHLEA